MQKDTVAIIDFSTSKEQLDLSSLTKEAQATLSAFLKKHSPKLSLRGFQEVYGHVNRRLVVSMGGHWDDDVFKVTSFGYKYQGVHCYTSNGELVTRILSKVVA